MPLKISILFLDPFPCAFGRHRFLTDWLTHWQTLKDRATSSLEVWVGALVTQWQFNISWGKCDWLTTSSGYHLLVEFLWWTLWQSLNSQAKSSLSRKISIKWMEWRWNLIELNDKILWSSSGMWNIIWLDPTRCCLYQRKTNRQQLWAQPLHSRNKPDQWEVQWIIVNYKKGLRPTLLPNAVTTTITSWFFFVNSNMLGMVAKDFNF